jgi:hypothetical protein
VNGDRLEDVFFGSAKGSPMKLFLQQKNEKFVERPVPAFSTDTLSENVDAVLFDADEDHDLDLFVVTGGNEFGYNDPHLKDKLFTNDGSGNFTSSDKLPNILGNGSCAAAADFDHDGDVDLFVGGRQISEKFGYDPPSHLYVNDGTGDFKNFTRRYFSTQEMGMITAVEWTDIDGDSYPELVVAGDWMPIIIYKNEKGKSFSRMEIPALAKSSGWWNCIQAADLDHDGDMDFVLGNLGQNSRIRVDSLRPAELYVKDFDNNGAVEQIITRYSEDNKSYPLVLKEELEKQLPFIKRRFNKHSDYKGKGIQEIFKPEELEGAVSRKVYNANTSLLINEGAGQFSLRALPTEAQYSPIFAVQVMDYNSDGIDDLLLCGNFYDVLPEIGMYDANYGLVLQGKGDFRYEPVKPRESGFFVKGQVRKMASIRNADGAYTIIVVKNNEPVQVFELLPKASTGR